ncbi:hypothetical protein COO91_01146 [Nostoc flagelliforme CCNUN1]|uniref:Uncharacterized protein n=1 Tax=Nostoc flagelliforme CCNUN1 TaxID=2038116 RepID=A0A2K8SIV8_9NOSO|nr:hypothetical protein COO91_01146 [Nostoc flagelliforme CCNUN1]
MQSFLGRLLVSTDNDQTWDEDTDGLIDLELSPEMKQKYKLFGVE